METYPFAHVAEVSAMYNVPPLEVMDVLDGFVQEMVSIIEIDYQGESHTLASLGNSVGHGVVDDIGDAIASQLFDDLTTTKFAVLTLHAIPEGEVFLPARIVSAMCDAAVDACDGDDEIEKAANNAFEETRWSAIAVVGDNLNTQVEFGMYSG